jgi:ABC-type lipoprotein release transport system permease subunit/SAM-dependent methyltransferase
VTTAEGFPFPEATLEAVAGKPGVRLAAPLVRGVASPDDGSGQVLTVIGVDLANETAVRIYHDAQRSEEVVGDLLAFLSQPDSIVATRQWAVERGVAVGDRVPLVTPAGLRTFTVRGLVEPQRLARALGGRLLVMDMYAAQQAFGEKGFINQIDVLLDDGADPAAVKAAIEAALPAGLVVREPATRRDGVVSAIRGFQAMLLVFALLAALAGIVICYSRLRSLFEARLFDIGLFRSIGLPQSVVFVELLKESMLLGAAGILVGLPAGALIARWAFPFMAQATALNFRLPVATSTPVVTPGALLLGVAVGLLAAILAAVVPAWRLASTQPVAALRLRGRSLPRVDARARLVAAGAIAAAAVVSAVVQQTTHLSPSSASSPPGFFIVSALTLAGPLVVHGARVLRRVHGAIFGPAGHLASAALHHQSTRATLAVATLAIGLGAVLFFGVLGRSFERSVVAQLGARFRADVVVSSAFASDGWVTAPLREEVVDEVRAIPGVTMVAAQHVRDVDVGGTTASIFAYDAACFRETRLCKWPLLSGAEPDAMESVATGQGALASVSVARELGVKVGDPITLDSPTGPRRFRLVGIAREEPAKAIIMCRDAYRASWNDRAVTWIHAALDDPQDAGPMIGGDRETPRHASPRAGPEHGGLSRLPRRPGAARVQRPLHHGGDHVPAGPPGHRGHGRRGRARADAPVRHDARRRPHARAALPARADRGREPRAPGDAPRGRGRLGAEPLLDRRAAARRSSGGIPHSSCRGRSSRRARPCRCCSRWSRRSGRRCARRGSRFRRRSRRSRLRRRMTEWHASDYHRRSALQQAMAEKQLAGLTLEGGEQVLDVGCGDGTITAEIAARVPRGGVLGVDPSHDMIAYASSHYAGANVRFAAGDARRLPYRNEFDLVVSFNALHWVPEQDAALASIGAALKPGGRALLRMVPQGRRESLEDVIEEVRQRPRWSAGFAGVPAALHALHGGRVPRARRAGRAPGRRAARDGRGLGFRDARGVRRVRARDLRRVDAAPAGERLGRLHRGRARPLPGRRRRRAAGRGHVQVLSDGSRAPPQLAAAHRLLSDPAEKWELVGPARARPMRHRRAAGTQGERPWQKTIPRPARPSQTSAR